MKRINAAKEHIEEIRRNISSSNLEALRLLTEADQLAEEFNKWPSNFVWELIQNAEDSEYPSDVIPCVDFRVIPWDITNTGCLETLLVSSNEIGFSKEDMTAICNIRVSTKHRRRNGGFIGQRGVGFKSVFAVSRHPHIISNGYQIRFTNLDIQGINSEILMFPEWVGEEGIIAEVKTVYEYGDTLPNTIIILPLKSGCSRFVRSELARIHEECLLFLAKLKKLTIFIDTGCLSSCIPVVMKSISLVVEQTVKHTSQLTSSIVTITAENVGEAYNCPYYIFRQRFKVRSRKRFYGRECMNAMILSIAFPLGGRLSEVASNIFFYYYPTKITGRLKFRIHSDFVMTSSMEIDLESKWNMWVFGCVPETFANAILCLGDSNLNNNIVNLHSLAKNLPFQTYSSSDQIEAKVMNSIIEAIEDKLKTTAFVPCEKFYGGEVSFVKPTDARRILPAFRELLHGLKKAGVGFDGMRASKKFPLVELPEDDEYGMVFEYYGVGAQVSDPVWYLKIIQDCNIVPLLNDELYMPFLCFIASNLSLLGRSNVAQIPLIKYNEATTKGKPRVCFALNPFEHDWLRRCNRKFGYPANLHFFPNEIQECITDDKNAGFVQGWLLKHDIVQQVTVRDYGKLIVKHLTENKRPDLNLLRKFPQFLCLSMEDNFIWDSAVLELCVEMPIIDACGNVRAEKNIVVLVPEHGSNYKKLLGSNPFAEYNYIPLGGDYYRNSKHPSSIEFVCKYKNALDLPEIWPPDVMLPTAACSELCAERAFLLLDWVNWLSKQDEEMPPLFLQSIREGNWMKTNDGFFSPDACALFVPQEGEGFERGRISYYAIEQQFYENRIHLYKDELKLIGVEVFDSEVA